VVVRPGGSTGGFELGGQVSNFGNSDLMLSIGMSWAKLQVRWSPGSQADANAINEAHARGLKILLSVLGEPEHSRGGVYFDEYAAYVGQLAKFGADAIEVWNETNLDREWAVGEIDPARYTELLKRAYIQIKANNPNTIVISAAPSPTGAEGAFGPDHVKNDDTYIRGMAAAGAANYMDCIGIHYNEGVISPYATSGDPRNPSNYYTRYYQGMVSLYYNAFGGARKLCFTELAFMSGEGYPPLPGPYAWAADTSVAEQAQWLGEAVTIAKSSGIVRLLIIWNVNIFQFGSDPMGASAIIRPDGSCPACTTIKAAMGR
jgi:hypothetical protein